MIINKITNAFNGWEYGFSICEYSCERSWLTDHLNKEMTGTRYASAFPVFKDPNGDIWEDPSNSDFDNPDEFEACGWWGWGYDAEEPVELKDRSEAIKFLVNEGKKLNLW